MRLLHIRSRSSSPTDCTTTSSSSSSSSSSSASRRTSTSSSSSASQHSRASTTSSLRSCASEGSAPSTKLPLSPSRSPPARNRDLEAMYQLNFLPSLSYTAVPPLFQSKNATPSSWSSQSGHEEILAYYGPRSKLEQVIEQASSLVESSGLRRELHEERPEIGAKELTITFEEPGSKGLSSGWIVKVNIFSQGDTSQLVGQPGWTTCHEGWLYKSQLAPTLPPIFICFLA